VPTGQNVGLLLRVAFTRNECGRPHRLEVIFQDIDGQRLTHVTAVFTPEWNDDLPVGWPLGAQVGLNFGIPLPAYGVYSFEVLIDDANHKTLNLRVIPPPDVEGEGQTGDAGA
jgi:uncharacterized protein DUF6941